MSPGTDESMLQQPAMTIRAHVLDGAERVLLIGLFLFFLSRMTPELGRQPYNALLIGVETLTAALILLRRSGPPVMDRRAWAVAAIGTAMPLIVIPDGLMLIPVPLGVTAMAFGLVMSLAAKVALARSFGAVAANRGVKRGGPYRLVRHPMYCGYLFCHAGFLALHFSLWNVLVYAATWLAMAIRIEAEESCLGADPAYRAYAGEVRYRLLPGAF